MNRQVIQYPNPILRQVSQPVDVGELTSPVFRQLVDDLRETVVAAQGAAISAVQVGVLKRVVVLHPELAVDGISDVLINPVLADLDSVRGRVSEGCLSMRGILASVFRPKTCAVTFTKMDGDAETRGVSGDLCQALQHELEHLDGLLLVDKVGPVKREMINRRMSKYAGTAVVYGRK